MKKSLLTMLLLCCFMFAGAASQSVSPRSVKSLRHTKSLKSLQKTGERATKDLYFNTNDFSYKWYEDDDASFWYFGCFDDSENYVMRLAYNTEEQTGIVTYGDMNTDYAYLSTAFGETAMYQEGTEVTIYEEDGYVVITGNLVCDNDTTYSVHAKCLLPLPDTYDIEAEKVTLAEYNDVSKEWDVRFKNDDWKVTLTLKSEDGHFAGTYTIDDTETGCYATNLNEDDDHAFTEMTVATTLPDDVTDPAVACEVTGTAKDAKGNTYNFHAKKNPPIKPIKTVDVDVDLNVAEWPSSKTSGSYYELTEKNNPENQWTLSLYNKTGVSTQLEGIDTTATYRTDIETEEELHLNNGTITQTFDVESLEVKVEAALVMNDSIQYNLSFSVPVNADGEETLSFTDLQIDNSYSEYGSTTINASSDNVMMYCELTDFATIPDEYTDANCRISLDIYDAGDYTTVSSNAIVYARTELAEDGTAVLHAQFLGDDNVIYTIEANFVKPEVTDTLHITADGCSFGSDDTGYYFCLDSEDKYVWIKVMSDEVAGHYTVDDLNSNSRICMLTESGMPKSYYLSEADIDVTCEDITYTLSGTCQAGSHFVYLSLTYTVEGLQYDSYEEDANDLTFNEDDIVELSSDDDDRYVYLDLISKQWNDELCMMFYPEEYDGTNIPAGEYEITSSGWGNYVQAGQSFDGGIVPSYYAKLDAKGNIQTPLWILYNGTVIVNEDGTFFVEATNSYGRTIHAVYTAASTDAITTSHAASQQADAFKMLKGSNLVIRRGDKEYNAVGQQMK